MNRLRALPYELTNALNRPATRFRHGRWSSTDAATTLSASPPSKSPEQPYFITTPIYYVNAAPHIGHLYSSVLADILARWARLQNPNRPVVFSTGTDEHGMKIVQAAKKHRYQPQEFCDVHSALFRNMSNQAHISYTNFIRTTDSGHKKAVQHVWKLLEERGHIYKGTHAGWYSVSDECFYGEGQVEKVADTMVSKETGQPVEWAKEENYMFRLSEFRTRLLTWMQSNPKLIVPRDRYDEVVTFLSDPTNCTDLSISRSRRRVEWGVVVPGDGLQTVYVWLDALINYMTVVGYPWNGGVEEGLSKGWPVDVQVVGKDIVKFHAIYFPAFLMALDLPLPQKYLAHAHWTMDGRKMSKSLGNVVDPLRAIEIFGADAVRLYMAMSGGSLADDADWSYSRLLDFYLARLANNVGNLDWEPGMPIEDEHERMHRTLNEISGKVAEHLDKMRFDWAAAVIMACLSDINSLFTRVEPWRKNVPEIRAARIQFYGFEALRIAGILLQPFMPSKADRLLSDLGIPPDRRGLDQCVVGAEGKGALSRTSHGEGKLFPKFLILQYPDLLIATQEEKQKQDAQRKQVLDE